MINIIYQLFEKNIFGWKIFVSNNCYMIFYQNPRFLAISWHLRYNAFTLNSKGLIFFSLLLMPLEYPLEYTLSLELLFMRVKDRVNLIIFTVALLIVRQPTQCIVFAVQCFCLRGNKDPSVLCQQGIKGLL